MQPFFPSMTISSTGIEFVSKKLFKNLNDRLSCDIFGLGGLAVVFDEFNRRAMAAIMSST
jgi:hypothetical protein